MTDFLANYTYTENEHEKRRRRGYVWYMRWHKLAKLLKQKAPVKDILLEIYKNVDNEYQHGYAWIAESSLKSLLLAIEDCSDCETCKDRFSCWASRGQE